MKDDDRIPLTKADLAIVAVILGAIILAICGVFDAAWPL